MSVHDRHPSTIKCCDCGGRSTRMYYPPRVNTFREYVTANITGEPVLVTSARQEDSLCKKHGVARLTNDEDHPLTDRSKLAAQEMKKLPPLREHYQQVRQEMGIEEKSTKPASRNKQRRKTA